MNIFNLKYICAAEKHCLFIIIISKLSFQEERHMQNKNYRKKISYHLLECINMVRYNSRFQLNNLYVAKTLKDVEM